MKNIIKILLLMLSLNCSAQMGFGTANPDASAILDLTSTNKGILLPRMSIEERNLIASPAKGLMIFNTDTNQLEINRGTSVVKTWTVISNGAPTRLHNSIFEIGTVTTDSTIDVLAPAMSITPVAGTYWVSFSSQFNNEIIVESTTTTPVLGTAQCALDLQAAYDQLIAFPTTDATLAPAMGTGQIIYPGVYSFIAAASIAGILTLDARGNSDALFIFKIGGAFAVGAASKIILANGAEARNIFFVSEAAPSIGAACTIKGTMIARAGAGAVGAGSNLEGRMFSMAGALTFGPSIAKIPNGISPINLGNLSSFALFTSSGDVSNTADSIITGNIGTNLGTITGLEISVVNGSIFIPSTPVVSSTPVTTTTNIANNNKINASFSIYQNNVLIPSSEKTLISTASAANISLQAIATVDGTQPIEVRWKTGSDKISLGNRILTVIKVQ